MSQHQPQVARSPQEADATTADHLRATQHPNNSEGTSTEATPSLPAETSKQDGCGFEDVDGFDWANFSTAPQCLQHFENPDEYTHTVEDFEIERDYHAQGGLPILPKWFWGTRDSLKLIRQIAHNRAVSADAVFYSLLARLAASVPPTARVDTGQKTPASLNLMVALVGESGFGKSSAADVAGRLLQRCPCDLADNLSPSSGEGIAEAYMGEVDLDPGDDDGSGRGLVKRGKTKTERRQVRHNAFFSMDEGEALFKMIERQGSTLGATLRTAWSGGTLGSQTATKERTRKVENYCLGFAVGFQLHTAQPLVDDYQAGTPQRFLWSAVTDPYIPTTRPDRVVPISHIPWAMHALYGLAEGAVDMNRAVRDRKEPATLTCDPAICDELWAETIAKVTGKVNRGQLDPHDSHRSLMLVKVAALLAILDGRTDVALGDWELAKTVWATSSAVRDAVIQHGQQVKHAEQQQRLESARKRAQAEEEGRDEHAEQRDRRKVLACARRLATRVAKLPDGATRRDLSQTLSRDRSYLDEAIEFATDQGWIAASPDGKRYVLGPSPLPAD